MEKRRRHTREFKIQAVKMITEQGLSASEVGRDLDINPNMLRRWKTELTNSVGTAVDAGELSEQEELKRLRKEVRELRMERDILKKATAFFAKESQ